MLSQSGPVAYGIIDENMSAQDVKVCLLGKHCVGKTSITNRFVKGTFGEKYVSTVGAAFSSKCLFFRDVNYRFALWDTAGEERYRSLAPLTYRGAEVAIIVYDITSMESFTEVEFWMNELRREGPEGILVYVVGNKIDLEPSRAVDRKMAVDYADNVGAFHFESSAKNGKGVEEIFNNICEMIRTVTCVLRRRSTIRVESVSDRGESGKNHGHGCRCRNS